MIGLKTIVFILLVIILPEASNIGQSKGKDPVKPERMEVLIPALRIDKTEDRVTDSLRAVLSELSQRRNIKLGRVVQKVDMLVEENRRLREELASYQHTYDTSYMTHSELEPIYTYIPDTIYSSERVYTPIEKKNIITRLKNIFRKP